MLKLFEIEQLPDATILHVSKAIESPKIVFRAGCQSVSKFIKVISCYMVKYGELW